VCKATGPDSGYQAGARGWQWIKLKRDYRTELSDTADLVVVGPFAGRGRRTGTYGAVLLAAYDAAAGVFRAVTKCGAGFSDADLAALPARLAPLLSPGRPARVDARQEPDVWFEPELVLEILSAELTLSPNNTAAWGRIEADPGLPMRFPRFTGRWRDDKGAQDATTTDELLSMFLTAGRTPAREHGGSLFSCKLATVVDLQASEFQGGYRRARAQPQEAVPRPRHLLHEPVHRRPGQHDRERGAAVYRAGAARLRLRPAVDHRRIHAGDCQPADVLRLHGGSHRAAQDVPDRLGPVHPRLAGVQPGARPGLADRLPDAAGGRRLDAQPSGDVDHHQHLHRRGRAGPGHRGVGRRFRPEHGARAGRRRRAGRLGRLAGHLLGQYPGRHRRHHPDRPVRAGVAGWAAPPARPAGPGARHRDAGHAHLRGHRGPGFRLGVGEDPGLLRRRRAGPGHLHPLRTAPD